MFRFKVRDVLWFTVFWPASRSDATRVTVGFSLVETHGYRQLPRRGRGQP